MSVTIGQRADLNVNIDFAKDLLAEFKQININDGINGGQALWLHHRMRAWVTTFGGVTYTLDIVNMAAAGDISTACLALLYGTADDMSFPYHWLNSTRIDWLTTRMKTYLGWP